MEASDLKTAPRVSVIVFTLNEEVNLPKCLDSLAWCDDVVIVDSFSTDRTREIATARGARFYQHEFTGFGDQRNWALETIALKYSWVLILDADEVVPPSLALEMNERVAKAPENLGAFRLRRRFYLWGKWLKHSSLYPTWVVRLIRVGRVRYINRGHAETQVVDGDVDYLENDLLDENKKDLHEWWTRQNDYSTKEAIHELKLPGNPLKFLFSWEPLKRREALKWLARKTPFRPVFFFFYSYVIRRGFLDGTEGLRFCVMKAMYFELIELKKFEYQKGHVLINTRQTAIEESAKTPNSRRPTA